KASASVASLLYPYTTLFRSSMQKGLNVQGHRGYLLQRIGNTTQCNGGSLHFDYLIGCSSDTRSIRELRMRFKSMGGKCADWMHGDRKSTRLNSSHVSISYAV